MEKQGFYRQRSTVGMGCVRVAWSRWGNVTHDDRSKWLPWEEQAVHWKGSCCAWSARNPSDLVFNVMWFDVWVEQFGFEGTHWLFSFCNVSVWPTSTFTTIAICGLVDLWSCRLANSWSCGLVGLKGRSP